VIVKMLKRFRPALAGPVLAATGLLFAATALAHHSTAMFEWGKEKKLEGTIDKFEWTQPHSFIWINVPGKDGKMQTWGLEGMSPSWLGRHDWSSRSLKAGEKISVDFYPLRDGRSGGFFVRVKTADGRTLEGLPGRPK
jgi:hypothetical protein